MKKLLYSIASIFIVATLVYAAGALQTVNPLPTAGANFMSQLTTFLRDENAQRYQRMFRGFVVSGGTHSTGASLTQTPTALVAFANGYYVTESGSITYNDNATCYVIADPNLTGNLATYTRVSGTHYLIDCSTTPTTPASAVSLMTVTTSGGSVTVVTDTRPLTAVGGGQGGTGLTSYVIGDVLYANSTTSLARVAAVADGSVFRSAGIGAAPLWGKVRLSGATNDISGTLNCANGGTNNSTAPANGRIPIGDGSCFTLNSITPGAGISVANSAGNITISSTVSAQGTMGSFGQVSFNNASLPNSRIDLVAQTVRLRRASDSTIVVVDSPSTITVDVLVAGPAVNGRDQAGAFSSSSWIHFYWIWNGTTLAGIASTVAPNGATGPTLPSTYTHWSYAGAVRFDGSSQLTRTRIHGARACYNTRNAIVSGANATVETTVSVSTAVPPNAYSYTLSGNARMAANSASDLTVRVISGSNFAQFLENYAAAADVASNTIEIPNVLQQFFYLWGVAPSNGADFYISCYTLPNGGI